MTTDCFSTDRVCAGLWPAGSTINSSSDIDNVIEGHFPQTALLSDTLQIYEIVRQSHAQVNFYDKHHLFESAFLW
jgi:hypothetical protein